MPLGTEVDLGLRDIVFDVDPATPGKRAHPPHPIFGSCLLWPNGWIDEDAAWYGSKDLGPGHIVIDWVTAPAKGVQQPPIFGPPLLWPRSPISPTAELLFQFTLELHICRLLLRDDVYYTHLSQQARRNPPEAVSGYIVLGFHVSPNGLLAGVNDHHYCDLCRF